MGPSFNVESSLKYETASILENMLSLYHFRQINLMDISPKSRRRKLPFKEKTSWFLSKAPDGNI